VLHRHSPDEIALIMRSWSLKVASGCARNIVPPPLPEGRCAIVCGCWSCTVRCCHYKSEHSVLQVSLRDTDSVAKVQSKVLRTDNEWQLILLNP
jgi:hypothetical protein